jgi:dihydrodipicolinate synthase/N-acetylneuraminate lyase
VKALAGQGVGTERLRQCRRQTLKDGIVVRRLFLRPHAQNLAQDFLDAIFAQHASEKRRREDIEPNPAPIKVALSLLHRRFKPDVRLPLVPVSDATGQAIAAALADLQLIA